MAIRIIVKERFADGTIIGDGYCNSDDTKPSTGHATGSKMTEVDTGDVYYFDEKDNDWVKPSAS